VTIAATRNRAAAAPPIALATAPTGGVFGGVVDGAAGASVDPLDDSSVGRFGVRVTTATVVDDGLDTSTNVVVTVTSLVVSGISDGIAEALSSGPDNTLRRRILRIKEVRPIRHEKAKCLKRTFEPAAFHLVRD
jgi:hypothetical protein